MASALELYGSGLAAAVAPEPRPWPVLRTAHGSVTRVPFGRWVGPVTSADDTVLDRALGPVLDVGCGVGRHVAALRARGRVVAGIDLSPTAVRLARWRGVRVVLADVFGPVPGAGTWRTALLLDGNIGIGGRPAALLARVGALLAPGGRALVELSAPEAGSCQQAVRLELAGRRSDWFAWATVEPSAIAGVAEQAGFGVSERWTAAGRRFTTLERDR